jgi:hypothetical protein
MSYTLKSWNRIKALTLFMLICYAGAIAFLYPGLPGGFGSLTALITIILSLACWAALLTLLIKYKQEIFPAAQTIETLIQERPSFFPPPRGLRFTPSF